MYKIIYEKLLPLVFDNNIIFADDTGTIFSIDLRGKINWKKNIYKKVYKKVYKNLSITYYKDKIYNSLVVLNHDLKVINSYNKNKLVRGEPR